jgi:hypothetical protein
MINRTVKPPNPTLMSQQLANVNVPAKKAVTYRLRTWSREKVMISGLLRYVKIIATTPTISPIMNSQSLMGVLALLWRNVVSCEMMIQIMVMRLTMTMSARVRQK